MPPTETSWENGTWCYVSNDCKDLDGGRHIPEYPPIPLVETVEGWFKNESVVKKGELAWEVCKPSSELIRRDATLGELKLEELIQLAERMEISLALALKAAYANSWTFWNDIKSKFLTKKYKELPEVLYPFV